MTIENGAVPAANDTALPNDQAGAQTSAENTEVKQGADDQASEDHKTDDEEDYELDGETFRIPRKLREAIAKPMLSDYTKKTQELADQKKAFDGEREGFGKQTAAQKAHVEQYAKVLSLNERIAEIEGPLGIGRYANVDWVALAQQDQAQYQLHRAAYDSLKDQRDSTRNQRDTAARAWTEKEQEYASNANRERGERVARAQTEIAKLVEGWTPGGDLDLKLAAYGNGLGFTNQDMAELAIRNPKFVRELNRLRVFDEGEQKQKQQQQFEQRQAAKPVTRVGGNGGSAARKTTDASGDALSADEWAKRERERVAKPRR